MISLLSRLHPLLNQFCHRIAEFESLARLLDVEMEWVERNGVEPWVIVDLAGGEEAAKRILSRSISAKYCIQGLDWPGANTKAN